MPLIETDEIEDMDVDSSTASEDVAEVEAQSAETEAAAESSPATDETEPDTLSIVRDVVGAETEETAEAASSAEGEEGTVQGDESGSSEPSDDYSDVPFNQHPRFRELLGKWHAAEQDAGRYRNVQAYIEQHGLTAEEAANGITIMGLAKLNPREAFKQAAPWFKSLAIAAGEILPDDLAQRVQKGELSKDVAQELSRSRAENAAQTTRQQFEQQRGERERTTAAAQALTTAAATWEQDRTLKDPNFAAKLPRIQEKIAFLHATGQRPTTPEGVRDQLKTVYEAVNRELGAAAAAKTRQQQRKPAITPVRGGAVAASAQTQSSPNGKRSTVDIIKEQLGQRA